MVDTTVADDTSVVPDSFGIDRFADDTSLRSLLPLYIDDRLLEHLRPTLTALGPRLGGELDELAGIADRNPPVLRPRTRTGQDLESVEAHPAYRALQQVAYGDLGMAAMSHRPGVLGWPEVMPPVVKYLFFYLFAQAEFGLECPVSMTDSLTRVLRKFGSQQLQERYLPGLTSTDLDTLLQGAMFMTEQGAGSDTGRIETSAVDNGDGTWSLHGQKWFCSNVDAELSMVLARPAGAGEGTKGIGLFLLPRHLPDGTQNAQRIVRLKDKLGTRSMPSGEVSLDGATAYLVGELGQGFKQMTDMINPSRLSNGVRSAGLMRRAFAEARYVCANREAFGSTLNKLPLQRRQLAKLLLPTEQGLSMVLHTADVYAKSEAGDSRATAVLRILTPLLKFRTTRDARKVTADAMEVRGGVGYIEEFGDARVFRDAQLGSIWEGTSNIVALDVIRAAHRSESLKPLIGHLQDLLAEAAGTGAAGDGAATGCVPAVLHGHLEELTGRIMHLLELLPMGTDQERVRQAASATYHLVSAIVLTWEGAHVGQRFGDWTRLVLAALVVRHKLLPQDPLEPAADDAEVIDDLVAGVPFDRERARAAVESILAGTR
ncbi:acyl-CoA dehydrogenase family protein [Brevibacterium moorei]|uniref:acyl-CoA dehydrogenase family protein n=1 Tax=Brevibacterium moorei TaxID=2968457 RepID=UPI00211CE38B|nr:acyl-CoA dehydrogenase family protein [Brevibacterium sp. 68QC2CO]MCQ9385220.1 acyl-CoA dehydrogenase family protein [Brevibacterium sp. 68QC2CO]